MKSKASQPQLSQFDIGNMKPGTVCTANCPGDYGEIDSYAPSHDEPGMAEIAKAERLWNRAETSKYLGGCVTRGIDRAANIV